jgi:hypothetical protein
LIDMPSWLARLGIRVMLVALACSALAWSSLSFGTFWRSASVERAASRIMSGETYGPSDTTALLGGVKAIEQETYCQPAALRAAVVIRLELVEEALLAGDNDHLDNYLEALQTTATTAIRCAPVDSFLWVALYRAKVLQEGFKPEDLGLLRVSYKLGPNEGWVALRRNRLTLSIYRLLPPDLLEDATVEFVGLVNSGFDQETAEIIEGPGWPLHTKLLNRLGDTKERNRQGLARILYHDAYDVSIPGIAPHEFRPWD